MSFLGRYSLNDVLNDGEWIIKVLCEQTRELTHDFLDYV